MLTYPSLLASLLTRRKMKIIFWIAVFASLVIGGTEEEKSVPVMKGNNVTLPIDVKQPNEPMQWYFNDTLIALINGDPNNSCLYDGKGGTFKHRLEVDYETGSLIIINITAEHAGLYEAKIIRANSTGRSVSFNRTSKCNSTKIYNTSSNSGDTIETFNVNVSDEPQKDSVLSPAVIAGICAGVVLLLAAAVLGVIYYRRRSSKMEDMEKNTSEQLLNVPA